MFGIRGLDAFGLVHALFGLASVALGFVVVLLPKGRAAHRRAGLLYTLSLVMLNITALFIYDLFGGFGPFHGLALLSLATVAAGIVPLWRRHPADWLDRHAHFMCWSYAGVLAAFAAEIAVRVPGVDFAAATIVPTVVVVVVAAVLIHGRVPAILEKVRAAAATAPTRW